MEDNEYDKKNGIVKAGGSFFPTKA